MMDYERFLSQVANPNLATLCQRMPWRCDQDHLIGMNANRFEASKRGLLL